MKGLHLRFCRTNRDRFDLPCGAWEQQGHHLECTECLAQCGDCEAGPFVEVEGEFLFADDLSDLGRRLEEVQGSERAPGAAGR